MPNNAVGFVAFLYAIVSRLAYVFFVGITLRREDRDSRYTRAFGPADAFRRFRRTAAIVMHNDAAAFILVNLITYNTLALPVSPTISFIAGAALVVVGLGAKLWAARTLGPNAYYWHNFFDPTNAGGPVATGPYRYTSNPMYTIGYLPTYGLALLTRSLPGMIAAVFAHATIIGFYLLVEKPHFERLHR
ncbi:MAG TPA: PEMT/PEM2 methyltransferase family protein [Gemmatimonadales bacterium]|nr:PEMT/PEM2 methyltransferase family protein [Gemmatimonadales bacterium]